MTFQEFCRLDGATLEGAIRDVTKGADATKESLGAVTRISWRGDSPPGILMDGGQNAFRVAVARGVAMDEALNAVIETVFCIGVAYERLRHTASGAEAPPAEK